MAGKVEQFLGKAVGMQQVEEDEGEERLVAVFQHGQVGDEVVLDIGVTIKGRVACRANTEIGYMTEEHTGKGRIYQCSTWVGTDVGPASAVGR